MSNRLPEPDNFVIQCLADAVASPNDTTPRMVLADWFEEQGDRRGELMRIQDGLRRIDIPRRQELEARMQLLLRDGVQAVVPRRTNSIGMRFVFIFPGEIVLRPYGQAATTKVKKGYWLGETVVTQVQWKMVMETEPWADTGLVRDEGILPDCPATSVSYDDAVHFCDRLSEQADDNSPYTLPTEVQWEYACRAGTTSAYSFGDAESELSQYASFEGNAAHQAGWPGPSCGAQDDPVGRVGRRGRSRAVSYRSASRR